MPSITFWTRLEPFTRLDDIDIGLQAQVHDPLWMLARQWQTGEFQGEDNGTPVQARLRLERVPLARVHSGPRTTDPIQQGQPYQTDIPLEALIEREPVQLATDPRRDLRLAAEAGLYFLSLLERSGASTAVRTALLNEPAYRLAAPADDPATGQDDAGNRYLSVMSGRLPDGFRLYEALRPTLRPPQNGPPRLPGRPAVSAADRPKVIQAGLAYLEWFETRYSVLSTGFQTWDSERMEYRFAVSGLSSTGELTLEAPEYPGGKLDWHSFNWNPTLKLGIQPGDPQPDSLTRTVMPAPLRYPGIAADRWWEFEDALVNFNRIEGDPDELMRLLLVQFALVYSNDWYILPVDTSPGAFYRVKSLVVTDAFGERTLVPHYSTLDRAPRDWRSFAPSLTTPVFLSASGGQFDEWLFLPPVLAASLHGDLIEEVLFLRDELSNLVWAVERRTPSLAGGALNRYELYHQHQEQAAKLPPEQLPNELSYQLATNVPNHWIPFLPVRIDPARPDIRLRRGKALLDQNDTPTFSRPLGRILEPERLDLSLFEEEVPRSGLRVIRQFQYARWLDGSTFLWLARRKGVGRGEGSSGLRFDIVDEP
jgi:hypothetical protein